MTAIEILRNEHGVILDGLALLEHHAREIGAGAPLNVEFASWSVQFFREFADDTHHAKEEGVLFALLERHGLSATAPPLAGVLADHRANRELAADMEAALLRADARAYATAALRLVDLLRQRLRIEDQVVFAAAEGMLTPADDAAAVQAFGRVVHEREVVLVRQRHLAAIERWRAALGLGLPPGA